MPSNFIPSTFTGAPQPPPPAPAPRAPPSATTSTSPSSSGQTGFFSTPPITIDPTKAANAAAAIDCPSCRIIGGGTALSLGAYTLFQAKKEGLFASLNGATTPRAKVLGAAGIFLTIAGAARMAGLSNPGARLAEAQRAEAAAKEGGEKTSMLPRGEVGTPQSIKESGHAVA